MTFRSVCIGLVLSMLLCLGSPSSMAAISLEFEPVDNSAVLTGYKTYDMLVTTDADWTAGAMLFELRAGRFYQHALGTNNGPHTGFLAVDAALEFDTYVVGSTAGGAGDVGGAGLAFGTDKLDVSWYNLTPDQIGTTTVARLTFTDDAAGSMSVMLTAAGSELAEFDVTFAVGLAPQVNEIIQQVSAPQEPETATPSVLVKPKNPDGLYGYFYGTDLETLRSRRLEGLTPSFDTGHRGYNLGSRGLWINTSFSAPTSETDALPEPGTLILIGLGTGTVLLRRR